MAAGRIVIPNYMPCLDLNGGPVAGAKIYFYLNETTTLQSVFADDTLAVPHPNPVIADVAGAFPSIFADLTSVYSVSIRTSEDVPIGGLRDVDGVQAAQSANIKADDEFTAPGASEPLTARERAALVRSPEDYGAKSGAVSAGVALANVTAFRTALESGFVIDGGGRTYSVSGFVRPIASFTGLRNITLRQVSADPTLTDTFLVDGLNDFTIDNVVINVNGLKQTGGLNNVAGFKIGNASRFKATRIVVMNGGAITGAFFNACSEFDADIEVKNFTTQSYASTPTDDVINGLWLNGCSDFRVWSRVKNLGAAWTGRPTPYRRWSRGLVLTGNTNGVIIAPIGSLVEQGIDATGSSGNRDVEIISPRMFDCDTWGVKLANHNQNVVVRGGQLIRCGLAGGVVASAPDTTLPLAKSCRFVGTEAINTGSNGLWAGSSPAGFRVIWNPASTAGYPAASFFENCKARDDQTVKTMVYGFYNDGAISQLGQTVPINELIDCSGEGFVTAFQLGFAQHTVSLTRSSFNVPNNAYTPFDFTTAGTDPAQLHDTGATISRIYFKVPGLYLWQAYAEAAPSATGTRRLLTTVGGAGGTNVMVPEKIIPGAAGANQPIDVSGLLNITAPGQYAEVSAFQDTGGTLTFANIRVTATLINRAPF